MNTNLFISRKPYFTLFSKIKLFFFFSLLQTSKLNLKSITTLQQPWTNWLAPTMWTLVISFDYLDVKLKVFKRDENKQFRLAQDLTMGEADFNQFIRLRNQLVVEVRDFSKEESLPAVQVKLLAKDMEGQLKLTQRGVEVFDRPHRKICVTVLR